MAAKLLFGREVSFETHILLRHLPQLDSIDDLVETALEYITSGVPPNLATQRRLSNSLSLDSSTLGGIFAGLYWLLRACMRSGFKGKALAPELEELRVHPPFVLPILNAIASG